LLGTLMKNVHEDKNIFHDEENPERKKALRAFLPFS
jgi:hypothetical protein